MIQTVLRFLVGVRESAFESYYQRVLRQAAEDVAPSANDARRDYEQYLRSHREYYSFGV